MQVPEDEVRAVYDYETEKDELLHPSRGGGTRAVEGGVQLMGGEDGNLESFAAEAEKDEGEGGNYLQREVG